MTRPLALCSALALFVVCGILAARAGDEPAARGRDEPLRQLLLESLREIEAMEKEAGGPAELELDGLVPGSSNAPLSRVLAMCRIGAALARAGGIDSARNTWQAAVDLASAITRLETKADALLEIATAQEAAGERKRAASTLEQASQAARLLNEGGRDAVALKSPFEASPLESKSSLLARIAEIQTRMGDKPASQRSFEQAREAAEAVEGHLAKVLALVGIAGREDPTGTTAAWDRPLEVALASGEVLQQIRGVEIVLRERIRLGAIAESLRVAADHIKGVTRTHALWIVADELAARAGEGRTPPAPVVESLAATIRRLEFRRVFEKERVLSRLAILQARCGATEAAGETLELLKSDDPVHGAELKLARARVACAVAGRQLASGNRASARAALRPVLELLSGVTPDARLVAELARLLAATGDRETALQAAAMGRSSGDRAEALAAVAAVLGGANDREGSKTALERASELAEQVPEETAWENNSREDLAYSDPRRPERLFDRGLSRKAEVLKSIAIAQARGGNIPTAYKTIDTILTMGELDSVYLAGQYAEALRAIAKLQADAGDFKGAWSTCSRLEMDGLEFTAETSDLLSAIAAGQAAAGDARGAMQSAHALPSQIAKLVALKGMADGIGRQKSTRQPPAH